MTSWQVLITSWVFVAGLVAESALNKVSAQQLLDGYPDVPYIVKFTVYWTTLYIVCLCWPALLLASIRRK